MAATLPECFEGDSKGDFREKMMEGAVRGEGVEKDESVNWEGR